MTLTLTLTLQQAQAIIANCLEWHKENCLKPLTVAVLDSGGYLLGLVREDGTSNLRPEIAQGKARGAVSIWLGSRALYERAKVEPFFIQAMNGLSNGSLVPVAGGVLIKKDGIILGAERWSCFFDQFAALLRWIRVSHQAAILMGSVLLAWTSSGVKMPWVECGRSTL